MDILNQRKKCLKFQIKLGNYTASVITQPHKLGDKLTQKNHLAN